MANDLVRPWMMVWVGLGALFLWRSDASRRVAIALMFAVPFVCLSWMTRKSNWYIVPVAPGLALIAALGLRGLPRIGGAALKAATVAGLMSVVFYSAAPDSMRRAVPQWVDRPYRNLVIMRHAESS